MSTKYLVVSPVRDEAQYMRQTLESVIAQSIPPTLWIIVDDGSTDATPTILAEYGARYDWIRIVTRPIRRDRVVGRGVIEAFEAGYSTVNPREYDYVCKLDLDLVLPPTYFELLMWRMQDDPRLASCSGKSYVLSNGRMVSERHGDDISIGATKFYRRDRFEALGGFVHDVMWDVIDVHRCRMMGWDARSWDQPDLRIIHLRPQGTSHGGWLTGRMRHGYGQYFMGTGLLYMVANAVNRFSERPYLLAGLAMLWGYLWSAMMRRPRYPDREFRRFLHSWQRRALFLGKQRAISHVLREREHPVGAAP